MDNKTIAKKAEQVILKVHDSIAKGIEDETKTNGQMKAKMFLLGKNVKSMVELPDMPENQEEKQKIFIQLGKKVAEKFGDGVDTAIFASEAWMSKATKGKIPTVRPSQDPEKEEVVIISSRSIMATVASKGENGQYISIYKMVRGSDGKLEKLEKKEELCGKGVESILLDTFFLSYSLDQVGDQKKAELLGQMDKKPEFVKELSEKLGVAFANEIKPPITQTDMVDIMGKAISYRKLNSVN